MEYRPLKITVMSAEGLKDKNLFSKMDVYTAVSLAGYPQSMKKTFVDKDCGTKPKWNHHMEFIIDEPYLTKPGLSLLFEIKAESAIRSDKDIGSVVIPINDLFQTNSSNENRVVEYQVVTPSGKPKGTLKISYSFGEKFAEAKKVASEPVPAAHSNKHSDKPVTAYPESVPAGKHSDEPVTAYPAAAHPYPGAGHPPQYAPPPQAAYGGYPPQSSGYGGYQQPPPPGYGYQQPPPGYGYPPAAAAGGYGAYQGAQKPKKNKMGMGGGMGLGLGAGLLGGLLVGDMIGDASSYADGYGDAMGDMGGGFDGGFDF